MTSAELELADAWQEFEGLPFPAARGRDPIVELAEYDALVAGIVTRVVRGERIPDRWRDSSRPDVELRGRIADLRDQVADRYVEGLERLIGLARRADASRQATT